MLLKDWALGLEVVGARRGAVEPGGKSCPEACSGECVEGAIGADADGIANRRYICSISSSDLLVWVPNRSGLSLGYMVEMHTFCVFFINLWKQAKSNSP